MKFLHRLTLSLIAKAIAVAMQVLNIALIARHLEVGEFGYYVIVLTISQTYFALFELGMPTRILRGIQSENDRKAVITYSQYRVSSFLLGIILAITSTIFTHGSVGLTLSIVFSVLGESVGDFVVNYYQGLRKTNRVLLVVATRRISAFLPLLALTGLSSAIFSSLAAGCCGVFWYLWNFGLKFKKGLRARDLIKDNFGMFGTSIIGNLAQLDTAIVGLSLGSSFAGIYGTGVRLLSPLNMAIATLIQVLTPELASAKSSRIRVEIFRKVRGWAVAVSISLLVSSFAMPYLTQLIFGSKYAASAPVVVAVTFAASLSTFAQIYLSMYSATNFPRSLVARMFFGVTLGLASIYLLSSHFGILGAAFGLAIMHLTVTTLIVFPSRRFEIENG